MMKCGRRQVQAQKSYKKCQQSFSRFLLVETEAEAAEKQPLSHPCSKRRFSLKAASKFQDPGLRTKLIRPELVT